MTDSKLLPLALLYVDGQREVDGATRFQKLVFLAQKETDLEESFKFRSDKYGPFSPELHATLSELQNRDLVEKDVRKNRSGNEKYTYRLTPTGRRVVQKLINRDDLSEFEEILQKGQSIKREYNNQPLDRVLRYVYSQYPGFTDKSELDEFKVN
ncbi:helix-turn-helix transcriptional regulator [Natrinema altunense]|uniref:PadR family transcriptional regulator n=1 Tax=Natrinema altunense TaxID=222984 RepID=A0A482Y375_9EURY|nr:helix-turn-helix transcriptional regulator [Natrinema altunense]RZH67197.1 PadR family transcriptional regulator [Natrinema altunense]